jgi:dolichol-phosphate mannosyltransferase
MDADLQDPPELLPQLVARWMDGFDVVYAVRQQRKEGVVKRIGYRVFYRLLGRLSSVPIALDAGDFCVMDRRVVAALRALPETQRFLRGLRAWVGFSHTGVPYDRPARHAGRPKYTLRRLIRLAVDGLVSFSSVPLRLATYLGLATALASVVYLGVAIYAWIAGEPPPEGWTSTVLIMLVLGAVELLVMAILGTYIARIFDEVKRRPSYVVRDEEGDARDG